MSKRASFSDLVRTKSSQRGELPAAVRTWTTCQRRLAGKQLHQTGLSHSIASFLHWLLHDLAQRPATDEQLQRLAVPALYLVGENEKVCAPLLALERLKSVAPRITRRLIAGASRSATRA